VALRHGKGDLLAGVHGGQWRRLNLAIASLPISSLSGVNQISVDLLLSLLVLATMEMEEEKGGGLLVGYLLDRED
jgi:hypothetical protein